MYDDFMKFRKLYKKEEIMQILDLKGCEVIADINAGIGDSFALWALIGNSIFHNMGKSTWGK